MKSLVVLALRGVCVAEQTQPASRVLSCRPPKACAGPRRRALAAIRVCMHVLKPQESARQLQCTNVRGFGFVAPRTCTASLPTLPSVMMTTWTWLLALPFDPAATKSPTAPSAPARLLLKYPALLYLRLACHMMQVD